MKGNIGSDFRVKTGSGEPSYQLTCCDSQHGSGSTEMSDDHVTTATSEPTEPLRSGKVVSGGSGASGGRAASGAVGTVRTKSINDTF